MCWLFRKQIETTLETPKPTSRTALMEITVKNNRTDSELIFNSNNDFGFGSSIEKSKKYIEIDQRLEIDGGIDGSSVMPVARFNDWSIIKLTYKVFDI